MHRQVGVSKATQDGHISRANDSSSDMLSRVSGTQKVIEWIAEKPSQRYLLQPHVPVLADV